MKRSRARIKPKYKKRLKILIASRISFIFLLDRYFKMSEIMLLYRPKYPYSEQISRLELNFSENEIGIALLGMRENQGKKSVLADDIKKGRQ